MIGAHDDHDQRSSSVPAQVIQMGPSTWIGSRERGHLICGEDPIYKRRELLHTYVGTRWLCADATLFTCVAVQRIAAVRRRLDLFHFRQMHRIRVEISGSPRNWAVLTMPARANFVTGFNGGSI